MRFKDFQPILARDGSRCWHCGRSGDDLVPQHRSGRGMGGSKAPDITGSANIITFCSMANGLAESDSGFAQLCRERGWKISRYEDPTTAPIWNVGDARWYLLGADGSKTPISSV